MKREVLLLLRQRGGYVSGQEICGTLGVSRTAVWKTINSLKEEGYQIEAVQNKGYCLVSAPDVLTTAEIGSQLQSCWAGKALETHERLAFSTNLRAKQWADAGAPHGALVVADVQEGGKGRRGRAWVTPPPGVAVAMSLALRPTFSPMKASMLTLLAALAVRDGVSQVTGLVPVIKWPNDLALDGKKICGILTEMILEEEYIQYVVVGIGINVNEPSFPEEVKDKATSLRLAAGKSFPRAEIVARTMEAFERYYETFLETEDLSGIQEDYNHSLAGIGGPVRVITSSGGWQGTSLGIDADGSLLVRDEEGKVNAVNAGEVSVRGLYGYV
ncbi:biotin--[acetyl-CoA-carboxylase] ligase [Hominifimenecus sp. rT4P-3]|uniref:biotin--[acetyl-CoA-carboxylase] ligase n=1 Tax=Hominifimenecus sp. rT4P-3 TaxID=3242979 RepID=UPI003DA51523